MLTDPFGTNAITRRIIGCAIRVHGVVGPGVFENVYSGVVIAEFKVVAALAEIHRRQVLTQLKLTGLPVGLLLNFNVVTLKEGGIKRVVNPKYGKEFAVESLDQ